MATVNLKFKNYGIIKNINDDQGASVNQFCEKYDLTDNKMSAVFQLKDNEFILWNKINVGCCDKGSGFGTQAISSRGDDDDYYALSFLDDDVNQKRNYWSFGSVAKLWEKGGEWIGDIYKDFFNLCCEIFDDFKDSEQYTLSIYLECESLLNEYDHFDVLLRENGLHWKPGSGEGTGDGTEEEYSEIGEPGAPYIGEKKEETNGKEETGQKTETEDKYLEGFPRDPWKYMDYYFHPETGEFAESLSSTTVHGMKLPRFSRVEELFIHFTAEELSGIINKIKDTGVIPRLPFAQDIIAEKFPNVTSHHCPLWLVPYATIGIDKPHSFHPGMYWREYHASPVLFNAEGFLYRPVFEEFGDPKTFTYLVNKQWLTEDLEWMDGFYGSGDEYDEFFDKEILRTCRNPVGEKDFDIIEAHPPECPANLDVIKVIWELFEENGPDYDVFREFSSWREVIEWGKSDSDEAEEPVEAAEPTPYLDATTKPPYPGDLYTSNEKWDGYAYETIPFPRVVGPGTDRAVDELFRKFTLDEVDAIAKKITATHTLPRLVWIPDLFIEQENYLIQDCALKAPFWFMPFVIYGFEKACMLYFELSGFHANLERDDALTQICHVDAIGSLTVVPGHHEDDPYHGDDDECISTMALKNDKGELWVSDIHGEDYGSQLPIIEAIWKVWLPMVDYNRDSSSFVWPPNLMEKLNLESFHSWDEVIEWAREPDGMEDDSETVLDETEPESEKSPMATAMSETYSNIEGGKYNVLHAITYIYLVLAHLTDSDLSNAEMALLKKKLHKYCDEYDDIPVDEVVADTISWYDEGTDEDRLANRVKQFDAIGAFLKESDWFEKGLQEEFLQDMVDVAKVDDNFHKYEKTVIRDLAELWSVPGYDFTGEESPVPAGDTAGEEIPEEPDQDDVSSESPDEDEEPEPRQQRSSGMRTIKVSGRMSVGRFEKEFEKLFGVRCEVKKGGRYAADDASLASLRPKDFKGQKTVVFGVRGNMKVKSVKKKFNECFGLNIQLFIGSRIAPDDATLASLRR